MHINTNTGMNTDIRTNTAILRTFCRNQCFGTQQEVKSSCAKVFELLAQAEAKVHGKPLARCISNGSAQSTRYRIVVRCLLWNIWREARLYLKNADRNGFVKCLTNDADSAPATAELLKTLTYYQASSKRACNPTAPPDGSSRSSVA